MSDERYAYALRFSIATTDGSAFWWLLRPGVLILQVQQHFREDRVFTELLVSCSKECARNISGEDGISVVAATADGALETA